MTVRELREKYLRFFESKGHLIHDSGSLIPYDVTGRLDESLLFNGAGMVQFKPYFRGIAEPPRTRVTTAQKCVCPLYLSLSLIDAIMCAALVFVCVVAECV